MKLPVVLVMSEGNKKPQEVVDGIRKIPSSEDCEVLTISSTKTVLGYILNLETKYYKTQLYLIPYEDDINVLHHKIRGSIECLLVFFDTEETSLTTRIPSYVKFVDENNLELVIFMCAKSNDSSDGVNFKNIKEASQIFDVVELEQESDDINVVGFEKVIQALHSVVWSNVNIEAGVSQFNQGRLKNSNEFLASCPVEPKLDEFEKLIAEAMYYKNNSSTWSRNQRLTYMEKFADNFKSLLSENESGSDNEI